MADIVRLLTPGEEREARWMFGNALNTGITRIHCGKYAFWQPDDTAMAPDGEVYFPTPIYHADFSISAARMWLLIHELTHVWQVQSGIWLKFRRLLLEGGVYQYGRLSPAKDLGKYTVEQQASIVADWYRLRHGLGAIEGSGALADYETVIRRAIPAAR
ncbi:vgr related protein [Sphingomonas sp.]|uniref:vgr related protein n=1 Tax=Sphingomonas sp. TaxID=28214 RepID=UPI003D6C9286